MKIKHFAGYGTVDAKVLYRTPDLVEIRVEGAHERGLARNDIYDAARWLGGPRLGRFDYTEVADMTVEDKDTSAVYAFYLK